MSDVGLGYEVVTQTETVTGGSGANTYDVAIPTGKVVISSGIQVTGGSVGGSGNQLTYAQGPHPTDSTKWRFQAQVDLWNGSFGYTSDLLLWMVVMNAA